MTMILITARGKMSVRLSVRLSATRRYSVETAKHIIKAFSPLGSATILVFPYQRDGNIPMGTPLTGASNDIHDFRPISRFISKMMQDRAIVTMEGE